MTWLDSRPNGSGALIGRDAESDALGKFLGSVRDGASGALVVLGEAGIGKTTLLRSASGAFADVRFIAVGGTESEQPLAYAGLQQLLSPFTAQVDLLPVPQRAALRIAFGMEAGSVPDRFLIGIAALTLLAAAARVRPLVALIDDAQWWDAESLAVLGFVGRRSEVDSLGLMVTVRADADGESPSALAGWPVQRLSGLNQSDSRRLLTDRHGTAMTADVLTRLFEGTGGNPLALLTVAAWLSSEQRSGLRPLPDPLPVGHHLEQLFSAQVRSLPAATGQLLLLAAAAAGEPAVFWKACTLLGLAAAHLDAAVEVGIVQLGAEVTFSHPLVRSAVYSDASSAQRRAVHAALAKATDIDVDPDRRSWHQAAATVGPDEHVADALERSSQRAAKRGGHTARAGFLRRAGELSVDPTLRTSRLLAAAQAYYLAGIPGVAQTLLQELPDHLEGSVRTDRDHLQMMLEIAGSRPRAVASIILRNLAENGSQEPRQIRDALLEALHSVLLTGRFGAPELARRVAVAALSALSDDVTPMTSADRLLKAFATRLMDDYPATVALLREAVAQGAGSDLPTSGITRFSMSTYAYTELWDVRGQAALLQEIGSRLRSEGALTGLIETLLQSGGLAVRSGRFDEGKEYYAEATGLLRSLGSPGPELFTTLHLAWEGREEELRALGVVAESVFGEPLAMGLVLGLMNYSLLILELSLGRYEQALVQAEALFAEDTPATGSLCLPPMVEAATRSGDYVAAERALARLSDRAGAVGNSYVRGMLSRSAALVSADNTAEGHYLEAIAYLGADGVATDLAWARLLYGEWLRRQKRRSDARTELRIAHEAFLQMGARLWAERARRELIATGERLFTPAPAAGEPALTPQEASIAALAAQGNTNQQIATQLFIGISTVEYHLTKIFRKHHLTSRRQLRQLLPQPGGPAAGPAPPVTPG